MRVCCKTEGESRAFRKIGRKRGTSNEKTNQNDAKSNEPCALRAALPSCHARQLPEKPDGAAGTQSFTAGQDSVTVEQGCTWMLTGDCALTSLENNGTINFGGYTIIQADGTVLC